MDHVLKSMHHLAVHRNNTGDTQRLAASEGVIY